MVPNSLVRRCQTIWQFTPQQGEPLHAPDGRPLPGPCRFDRSRSAGLAAAAGLGQLREGGRVVGAAAVIDRMAAVVVADTAAGGGDELELGGTGGSLLHRSRGPTPGEFIGPPCPRCAFDGVAAGAGGEQSHDVEGAGSSAESRAAGVRAAAKLPAAASVGSGQVMGSETVQEPVHAGSAVPGAADQVHDVGRCRGEGLVDAGGVVAQTSVGQRCPATLKAMTMASLMVMNMLTWKGPAGLGRRGLCGHAGAVMVILS